MTLPLEVLLTSSEGFGLTTATPVQRAICRASDGIELGELWDDPTVRQAFGGACPRVAPLEFVILAAIRCGKSLFSAAKAIQLMKRSLVLDYLRLRHRKEPAGLVQVPSGDRRRPDIPEAPPPTI